MRKLLILFAIAQIFTATSIYSASADQTEDYLRKHKITQGMVDGLALVANSSGYGPISNDKSSWSSKYVFAYLISEICLEVRAGKTSWAKQINRDIQTGASPSQARALNNYAKKRFCPRVK